MSEEQISEEAWERAAKKKFRFSTIRRSFNDSTVLYVELAGPGIITGVSVNDDEVIAAQAELDAEDEVTDVEIEAGAKVIERFLASCADYVSLADCESLAAEIIEAFVFTKKARHV